MSEQITQKNQPANRIQGLVPALVTNTDDPKDMGRVKLKFPWLDESAESNWARVIGIGAGPESGYYVMPAIDDEVMVGFMHGDFNYPIVVGGVWNGQNKIPPEGGSAGNGEKPQVRSIHSTNGHKITMYDNADKKIEIITTDGQSIILDDKNKKIEIKASSGKITLEQGKISIEHSGGELAVKTGSNMKWEAGGNIEITASGNVTIKGAMVDLNP